MTFGLHVGSDNSLVGKERLSADALVSTHKLIDLSVLDREAEALMFVFDLNTDIEARVDVKSQVLCGVAYLDLVEGTLFRLNDGTAHTEELHFHGHLFNVLNESHWLLAEAGRNQKDVPGRSLDVKLKSDLDFFVKLEVSDRLVVAHRSQVLYTLGLPVLVLLVSELAESINLLQGLHGVAQEDHTFSERVSTSLRAGLSANGDLLDHHP